MPQRDFPLPAGRTAATRPAPRSARPATAPEHGGARGRASRPLQAPWPSGSSAGPARASSFRNSTPRRPLPCPRCVRPSSDATSPPRARPAPRPARDPLVPEGPRPRRGRAAGDPPQVHDPADRGLQRQAQPQLRHDPVAGSEHPPGRDQDLQRRIAQFHLEDEPPVQQPEPLQPRARRAEQPQQRRRVRPRIRVGLRDQNRHAGPEGRAPRVDVRVLPDRKPPIGCRKVRPGPDPERKRRRLEAHRARLRRPGRAIAGVAPHAGPGAGAPHRLRVRRLAATHRRTCRSPVLPPRPEPRPRPEPGSAPPSFGASLPKPAPAPAREPGSRTGPPEPRDSRARFPRPLSAPAHSQAFRPGVAARCTNRRTPCRWSPTAHARGPRPPRPSPVR